LNRRHADFQADANHLESKGYDSSERQTRDGKTSTYPNSVKPSVGTKAPRSASFGDAELPDTRIRKSERVLREMRATALTISITDAHPDDARQLLTAALIDLSVGMPEGNLFASIREDAKWWAGLASPAELFEVLAASLESLRSRAMHRDMRKRLFFTLWRAFSPEDKTAFLAFANGEVRDDH
jgi:hypothetical protein